MLREWDKFRLDLDIPKEEYEQANYGLGDVVLDRTDYLSPLTSQPSEIWSKPCDPLHPYPTTHTSTYKNSPMNDFDKKTMETIQSDLNEIFDPIGIMGSFGKRKSPNHVSTDTDSLSKNLEPVPVPRRIGQSSLPWAGGPVPVPRKVEQGPRPSSRDLHPVNREQAPRPSNPVNRQDKDVECGCETSRCTCTSSQRITRYFTNWQLSVDQTEYLGNALRRHSIPETKKLSENFGTHTPPSTSMRNTPPIVPREIVPTPSPEHQILPPRTTVRTPNPQNMIREKTVVCLYPQQTFSSNDSVNEGIFGDCGIKTKTLSHIPNECSSSPVAAKTRNDTLSLFDPLLDDPAFNFSLASSTNIPSSNFDEAFAALEQPSDILQNTFNVLNDRSEVPRENE